MGRRDRDVGRLGCCVNTARCLGRQLPDDTRRMAESVRDLLEPQTNSSPKPTCTWPKGGARSGLGEKERAMDWITDSVAAEGLPTSDRSPSVPCPPPPFPPNLMLSLSMRWELSGLMGGIPHPRG